MLIILPVIAVELFVVILLLFGICMSVRRLNTANN